MHQAGADCSVVAVKRGNARGAKGAGHSRCDRLGQPARREEPAARDGRRQPLLSGTSRMSREAHVRLCVQQRLARSAGDKPAKARARSLVAWMAGRRETNDLKPIDRVIIRMTASHRAAAQANAQVAPKVRGPGGRARIRRAKAAWRIASWSTRCSTSAGW